MELSVQLPGETKLFVEEMREARHGDDNYIWLGTSSSGEQDTQETSSAISSDPSGRRSKVSFATHSDETEELDRKMANPKSTVPPPDKCVSQPMFVGRGEIPSLLAMEVTIPTDEERKKRLEDNLEKMGCASLMQVPWSLRNDNMLREFLTPRKDPGQYGRAVRSDWSKITVEMIGKAFGVQWESEPADAFLFWQHGTDESVHHSYFVRKSTSDEGYKVDDCSNEELKDILMFLGPIIYSSKPKFLPLYLLNTIILSWRGTKEVAWGAVLFMALNKLIEICHRKQSRLGPFLYRMYHHTGSLTSDEKAEYAKAEMNIGRVVVSHLEGPGGLPAEPQRHVALAQKSSRRRSPAASSFTDTDTDNSESKARSRDRLKRKKAGRDAGRSRSRTAVGLPSVAAPRPGLPKRRKIAAHDEGSGGTVTTPPTSYETVSGQTTMKGAGEGESYQLYEELWTSDGSPGLNMDRVDSEWTRLKDEVEKLTRFVVQLAHEFGPECRVSQLPTMITTLRDKPQGPSEEEKKAMEDLQKVNLELTEALHHQQSRWKSTQKVNLELTLALQHQQSRWQSTQEVVDGLQNLAGPNLRACGMAFRDEVHKMPPSQARRRLLDMMEDQENREPKEVDRIEALVARITEDFGRLTPENYEWRWDPVAGALVRGSGWPGSPSVDCSEGELQAPEVVHAPGKGKLQAGESSHMPALPQLPARAKPVPPAANGMTTDRAAQPPPAEGKIRGAKEAARPSSQEEPNEAR